LEFLREDDALTQLAAEKRGLSSPELCMLIAYAKISVTEQLLSSGLTGDEPWLAQVRRATAFRSALAERFAAVMNEHPLWGEIITVSIVKYVINNLGLVPPPGFRRRPSPPSS
jgi:glutamate dehydrogenase